MRERHVFLLEISVEMRICSFKNLKNMVIERTVALRNQAKLPPNSWHCPPFPLNEQNRIENTIWYIGIEKRVLRQRESIL